MKKIAALIIIIASFGLAGCKEEKPATVAPTQQDINVNGPGQSTPAPGPLVLPEKGKYKY